MWHYFLFQSITLSNERIAFLHISLTIIGAILFVIGGTCISIWLRPHKPYVEKLTTYESGTVPVGNAWGAINSRLYVIGLVFILFELETILLFPWATVWAAEELQQVTDNIMWTLYMAMLGTFFILVLGIGLVYAVVKGRLVDFYTIVNPNQSAAVNSKVPLSYYEKLNKRYASHNPTTYNNID
jgi:NADH-quinone oxidoreductase subunit A